MIEVRIDNRPARHGWAPGSYICHCVGRDCDKPDRLFIGAKGAFHCAECAYKLPHRAEITPPPSVPSLGYGRALSIAERGLERWKSKDHNRKWWRRIDGTPIPNDLLSCIAEAFAEEFSHKSS